MAAFDSVPGKVRGIHFQLGELPDATGPSETDETRSRSLQNVCSHRRHYQRRKIQIARPETRNGPEGYSFLISSHMP